jgi:DNA-binding CsgD family transcriptional regulator/PAS domain-containing protein
MEDEGETYDGIVGALYDAALEPHGLTTALTRLTDWIDGDTCHLVGWNKTTGEPTISRMIGLEEVAGSDYASHHSAIDPRLRLAMAAPGSFIRCHEHFDKRFVSGNEFFQDFLLPRGVHYLLGITDISHDPQQTLVVGFHRYIGHEPFDDVELRRVTRITPHLRRSLALRKRNDTFRQALSVGEQALDLFDEGVFALDATSRIVFANRRAQALMREGNTLSGTNGRLRSVGAPSSLADALDRVRLNGVPQCITLVTSAGADAEPATDAPRRMHCLTLSRLRRGESSRGFDADWHATQGALFLVLVTSPDQQRVVSVRQLMQLFHLTPAEARVAHMLASGRTLEEYSREQAVKMSTARTQLRGVFAKTGVNGLQALQRLLAMLPSMRPPGSAL